MCKNLIRRMVLTPGLALALALALVGAGRAPIVAALEGATIDADVDFGRAITFRLEAPFDGRSPDGIEVRFGLPGSIVIRRAAATFELTDGMLRASHTWEPRAPLVVGAEIGYHFVLRASDGEIDRSEAARVIYIDSNLSWERVTAGDVEIWYHAGGESVEADARFGIRTALDVMSSRFGAELERQTRLILYDDVNLMREALGGGSSPWVAGAAIPDFNVTVLHASAGKRDSLDLSAKVAHEITHIVLEHRTQNSFGGLPAWLHEGLATTVESEILHRFPYANIMATAVERDEFVSLRGITGSFPAHGNRALQAYAQSNSLVTYIIDVWGDEGIAQLLDAYAGGVSDNDALIEALGISLDDLERDWLGAYGVDDPALTRPDTTAPLELTGDDGMRPKVSTGDVIFASVAILPIVTAVVITSTAVVVVLLVWRAHRGRPRIRH